MTPTNRIDLTDPSGPLYYRLREPSYDSAQAPIFPGITIWRWYPMRDGGQIFPSIQTPTSDSMAEDQGCVGQDFDGSIVAMVLSGPEKGCTYMLEPPHRIRVH